MITFFMVPLYTHYLTTSDYGKTDLITTVVGLLTPLLTLSATESVFRFAMVKSKSKGEVLTNGMLISFGGLVAILMVSPFLFSFPLVEYILVLSFLSAIELMFQEFARGIGESKIFAITGILMTIITVSSNIVLIVFNGWKLNGFLVSLVLAQLGGILFLVIRLKLGQYLRIKFVNHLTVKRMLSYSVPLIPNQISWWISNSASKLFIAFFLGTAANGLFAVANKIPSLISVFTNVFSQAWQISAVDEFKKEGSGEFFSRVLALLTIVVCVGVIGLSGLSRLFVLMLSNRAYLGAAKAVPWLALAVAFSTISSFLGTVYAATMKTGFLFVTTLSGAIVNVIANAVLIPMVGLNGAGIGAYLSFLVVTILRYIDAQKFIRIKIDWLYLCVVQVIVFIEYFGLFVSKTDLYIFVEACGMIVGLGFSGVKGFYLAKTLHLRGL